MDTGSYFAIVTEVTTSWDKVKMMPEYEKVMGTMLFKKIFEDSPSVLDVYNFKDAEDPSLEKHAKNWVRMLDLAIHMLGPDMELVEETLYEVGGRHVNYGVLPKHYPRMGRALMSVLGELLKDSFTSKTKDAWSDIYSFFSTTMIQGSYDVLMNASKV